MQRIIRRSFPDEPPIAARESQDLLWKADMIAQAYLQALRRAVPDEPESPVLWGIPLNLSERVLLPHVQRLNEMLCQLARAERWHACQELWDQADKLVRTLTDLALKNPEPFKSKARKSLFMPSLRVPPKRVRSRKRANPKWVDPFLGDSVEIAQAIELSADTVGAKISDNRTRLGALCAQLVGECVQEIKRSRYLWTVYFTPYKIAVIWPTRAQIKPFIGKSLDELLAMVPMPSRPRRASDDPDRHVRFFSMQSECGSERLHFLLLPELTVKTARTWWKDAIEQMVEARFSSLLQTRVGRGN